MIAGQDVEAGAIFADLAHRFPADPYGQLWHLVWHARRGDVQAVRSGFTADVINLVRVDEGCTYGAAAACALIGDRAEALRWFEHMVRDRGFIAYPYFATIDPFLVALRGDPRFQAVLEEMKTKYDAFDTQGTAATIPSSPGQFPKP
jgi:hypothetical protein